MPTEHLEDFDAHSWARALLSSSNHTNLSSADRHGLPPLNSKCPNRLITETFFTDRTIRAQQILSTNELAPPGLSREYLLLFSLAEGLDGWRNVMHGGLMGVLMDFAAGCCVTDGHALTGDRDVVNATTQMKIEYKRPLRVPGIVLVRSVMTRQEAGKRVMEVVVEDGMGVKYAKGEVMYVQLKSAKL